MWGNHSNEVGWGTRGDGMVLDEGFNMNTYKSNRRPSL